ncbi:hypothetical protein LCGC14_0226740 [marine sediment metagenome]|uniref:Uncharacterized protein n=2 Tax=root TaxID=1 RepID=A0A7V1BM24_9GAMM|nr:hypothetical protein [Halopseudomonas xinjiangensis]
MHSIPLASTPDDGRDYRLYHHANGLRCLLVSDPSASQATCVAQVDAGSHDEPDSHAGLAHLLEHMLFMGSEYYPEPGSFPALVSRWGGRYNASTAGEETRFFFSVASAGLLSCIGQLADMLAAPLIEATQVGAERQVIHAEFHTRLADDALHAQAALGQVTNSAHPLSRFSAGNATSLNGTDSMLASLLLQFHRQYYRAANMVLVLHANQPLADLLALAASFAERQAPGERNRRTRAPVLGADLLPGRLQRQAQSGMPRWQLMYPLAEMPWLNHDSAGQWLCEWIASPTPAGALGWLRDRHLISQLTVHLEAMPGDQGLLCIELQPLLKPNDYPQLLDAWQVWLNGLAKTITQHWPTDARKSLLDQSFALGPQGEPVEWLKVLAQRLMRLPVELVLEPAANRQPLIEHHWRALLSQVQPANLLLVQAYGRADWPGYTPWTHTGFQYDALSWRPPARGAPLSTIDGLHFGLPLPLSIAPMALEALPGLRLLDLPSHGSTEASALQLVKTRLTWCWRSGQSSEPQRVWLQACWALQIESLARCAELAGVIMEWQQATDLLSLTLSGPLGHASNGILAITRNVLSTIARAPEPGLIELAGYRLRAWQAEQAERLPAYRCLAELDALLAADPGQQPRIYDDPPASGLSLWRCLHERAQLFWLKPADWPDTQIDGGLLASAFPGVTRQFDWGEQPARMLPKGVGQCVVTVQHADRGQLLYCQARAATALERAGWRLLHQLLASAFFDSLRTRQQLGYWVVARYHEVAGLPGLLLLVQSPSHEHAQIAAAMELFLLQQQKLIGALPFTAISAQAERLADALQAREAAAEGAFERYWQVLLGRVGAYAPADGEALRQLQPAQWQEVQAQLWGQPVRLRLISETHPKVAHDSVLPKHQEGRAL